jgi:cobalt-zinc-cadmium efflux system outer membrane protein
MQRLAVFLLPVVPLAQVEQAVRVVDRFSVFTHPPRARLISRLYPALIFLALALALASVSGCARYKYHPVPLSPPALAQSLEARSLDDPDLRAWMDHSAGFQLSSWPLQAWDLNSLTLAAFYFNPDLDMARANAAAADAAITTAAAKPNPSVSFAPGYQTPNPTQFITTFDFSLPIETAGKRGYRIANATQLSRASRLQLGQAAWVVRSRVRATLVDYLFAVEAAELLRKEEALRNTYVDLTERRLRAGEIPLPDVTTARIDQTALRLALRNAEGQVHTTHVALAAAIGIPDSGLAGKNLIWREVDRPPAPESLPPQTLRSEAVQNRLDVQRALAQYEAAQAALQLEVARQYPDINLGPSYAYEEGSHFIQLGLSTVLPLRNRNEGPIAQAEAQRKVVGSQLLAVQSTVISDTDRSLGQYIAAYTTMSEADRSVNQLQEQQRAAIRMLQSGETGQLTLTAAELQTSVAERSRLDAIHQAQLSLGLVEDALQRPISPGTTQPLPADAPR